MYIYGYSILFSNKKIKITECNFKTVIRYQITYKLFHMLHIWYFLLVHFQNHCRGLIPQRLRQPWITSYYLVMAVITPGVVLDWTLGELYLNTFFSIKLEPVQRHRKRALRSSTPTDLCLGLELAHLVNAIGSLHFSICCFLLYDQIHSETSAKLNKSGPRHSHISNCPC